MRYAIVSDIHANVHAWNMVLADIADQDADRILCLGDIVGYGPDPVPVLESVYRHVHAIAMGNHDAATAGRMDDSWFTDSARSSIRWTRAALDDRALAFLRGLPLVLAGERFRCAHGGLEAPAAFSYVIDPCDALPSWASTPEPLLFVGHSHVPAIFVIGASRRPHRIAPEDFVLEPDKRFLVNVGSVGCPRNGDSFATYCLYDEADGAVRFRRVPYDLDAYRQAVARTGRPTDVLGFLSQDPRERLRPIRDQLSFSPPTAHADYARADTTVQSLTAQMRRTARRWRRIALALALGLAATGVLLAVRPRHAPRPLLALPATPLMPMPLTVPAGGRHNLLPSWLTAEPDGRLRNWRVIRRDALAQSLAVHGADTDDPVLVLESRLHQGLFRVEAPPVLLDHDGVRLRAIAQFRHAEDFEGHVGLVMDIVKRSPDGTEAPIPAYQRREPRQRRSDGWIQAQMTLGFPRDTHRVQFAVEGEFRGRVEIRHLALERAD